LASAWRRLLVSPFPSDHDLRAGRPIGTITFVEVRARGRAANPLGLQACFGWDARIVPVDDSSCQDPTRADGGRSHGPSEVGERRAGRRCRLRVCGLRACAVPRGCAGSGGVIQEAAHDLPQWAFVSSVCASPPPHAPALTPGVRRSAAPSTIRLAGRSGFSTVRPNSSISRSQGPRPGPAVAVTEPHRRPSRDVRFEGDRS
jgi:hypothetical protein